MKLPDEFGRRQSVMIPRPGPHASGKLIEMLPIPKLSGSQATASRRSSPPALENHRGIATDHAARPPIFSPTKGGTDHGGTDVGFGCMWIEIGF